MKIAIHQSEGSFSDYWIEYCKRNNVPFKIVDTLSDNIIAQLDDCDALMWHHHHNKIPDNLIAKGILNAVQQSGKIVFPDFKTGWHFDDKLGQKYLLEAIGAPLVKSYTFYDKETALKWVDTTTFPKVFKLRGGAGSFNVSLVKTQRDAKKLINRCFGKGFKNHNLLSSLKYQWRKYKSGRVTLRNVINFSVMSIINYFKMVNNREYGYAYFQDFIPNNNCDIRVVVIGDKAFALKRMCAEGDFRASGSGLIVYNREEIDERCVEKSFEVAEKLGTQCIGFDWVFDEKGTPMIVEMSYGFSAGAYFKCDGYWTKNMKWHPGTDFDFCGWMVEDVVTRIKNEE